MSSLTLTVDTHVRIDRDALKRAGVSVQKFRKAFEYDNPDFHRTARMGYYTGNVARTISLLEAVDGEFAVPRGAIDRVRTILRRHRVDYVLDDRTRSGTGPVDYEFDPPFSLHPDQRMAIKLMVGKRQGILKGACASGKTTIALAAISRTRERAIVIVHTERILSNWLEEAREYFGTSATVGALYGKRKQPDADVVIATIQTLRNWIQSHPKFVDGFGVVVLDEAHHCFPAGTLVGDRKIEEIREGDFVPSFDPDTRSFTRRRVVSTMTSEAPSLYEIEVDGEFVLATGRHPFFVDGRGWVDARDLQVGDMTLSFTQQRERYAEDLRMRASDRREGNREVLREVSSFSQGGEKEDDFSHVRGVRGNVRENGVEESARSSRSRNVFESMRVVSKSQNLLRDDATYEPSATSNHLGAHDLEEPDERTGGSREGFDEASNDRVEAANSSWKRDGTDGSGDASGGDSGVGERSLDCDGILDDGRQSVSVGVQGRRRESRPEGRNRSGRRISQESSSEAFGREEGSLPRLARVDGVKVLERGRDGTFGGRCPGGRVYNLEVEGTSTYLVGENAIGVHNCPASTFSATVSKFPALHRWALTATPKRKDGKEVLFYDAFGSVYGTNRNGREVSKPKLLVEIDDADLDRYGRIVPVDLVVVPTDFEFDLNFERRLEREGWERKPRQSATASAREWVSETGYDGSPNTYADMLSEMSRSKSRQARILEFLLPEIRARNPSIVLADRREICLETAHWLARRGIECGRLMGGRDKKEQERTSRRISEGELFVAVGTTVADEGMNIKPLSRGFGTTPAASNPGRLTQQFGRLKRKFPGKTDAVYHYFWDRRVRGLRGHLRAIARAIKPPHRVWFAEKPGSENRRELTSGLVRELEDDARRRFK